MKKAYSVFAFLLAAVLAVSCFNPLNNGKPTVGNLHIAWGNFDRSRSFVPETELPNFNYTVTLNGPGEPIQGTFKGASSASFKVKPGDWTVTVKGRTPSDTLRVMGIIEKVTVTAKKSAARTIVMYTATEVDTWAKLAEAVRSNDDDPEAGEREELFLVTEDMITEDINNADVMIPIKRKVIIISEKPVTIGRPDTSGGNFPSFFKIEPSGLLTLGMAGMGGTLGFDNADKPSASLFVVEGELVMNKDVRIANCNTVSGGGVYVASGGTFAMNGGVISGNKASSAGGGVYIQINGNYQGTGGTFSGNFNGNRLQDVYREGMIWFTLGDQAIVYGDSPLPNTITGKQDMDNGAVTYSSNNAAVATVDGNSGAVTIIGAGQAVITATKARDGDYAPATASYTLTVAKDNGSAVSKPAASGITQNSITVNPVTLSTATGQNIQYAINANSNADLETLTWGSATTFSSLTSGAVYYVYARSVENGNYNTGEPSRSDPVTTHSYGISLSATGDNQFPSATFGYGAQTALSVNVTNNGNQATGGLTVGLSGANQADFTLSTTSIPSIVGDGSANGAFTVVPNPGLSAGTYNATITVSGSNSISAAFNVSFAVNPATINIPGILGVTDPVAGEVPVTAIMDSAQYTGTVSWSPAVSTAFAYGTAYTATITLKAKANYTLLGVTADYFTITGTGATATNSANSGAVSATFPKTTDATYGISLLANSASLVNTTHTFTAAMYTYPSVPTALSVTVTNTGNQATDTLTIAMSGATTSFTLSKTSISGIAASGTDSFTVVPITGLAATTHAAAVTVSGPNIPSQTFNVSFTVNPATIDIKAINGLAAPKAGEAPVTAITESTQYTGNVTWSPTVSGAFSYGTAYTATITLAAKANYTLTGVTANFFTVTGASTVSNNANSGTVTATFPATTAATYIISLSQTGTYTFNTVTAGYTSVPAALSVNVRNEGNQPTGALTAALSSTDNFTLTGESINSIEVGNTGTGAFSVRPKTGLVAGAYTATVTVTGNNGITASFTVSITVNAAPTYGISLSQTELYPFPAATFGYTSAPTELSVNVKNEGNQPTGVLTAALSSTTNFTLVGASITSIEVSSTRTGAFSVQPKAGLAAGTYTATVTVSGSNSISASFNVSFTVNPAMIDIKAINGVNVPKAGEAPVTAITESTQYTGNVTWSPTVSGAFSYGTAYTATITLAAKANYTLTGVTANFFTVTGASTVSNNANSGTVTATFPATTAATYIISLSQTTAYTFDAATYNYESAPTALSVTVRNEGNQPTGSLTVALSGATTSFTLSKTSISSIAVGGTDTFTVRPNTGLAAGTHTATVTVSGGTGITSRTFNVNFTVNAATISIKPITGVKAPVPGATPDTAIAESTQYTGNVTWSPTVTGSFDYGKAYTATITLVAKANYTLTGVTANFFTVTGATSVSNNANSGVVTAVFPATANISLSLSAHTFPAANYNYPTQTALSVNVTNPGSQATGTLNVALSGTNASSFTLLTSTVSSIAGGGSTASTGSLVRPNAGLVVGTYTATVTVSGSNGITASFTVSFTVNIATIDIKAINGVLVPKSGETPVTAITESTQYTGNVTWSPTVTGTFAGNVTYTATITLVAKANYTLTGVTANFFTVTGATSVSNNANSGVVTAVFPVTALYSISLSQTGTYPFPERIVGYTVEDGIVTPLSVSVTNNGNQATGDLTVALSGTNASTYFTLSTTSLISIPYPTNGTTRTFTVVPKYGLAAGTYTAAVTVSGGNGISANFTVSFTVVPPYNYVITQSSTTSFTAVRGGVTTVSSNQPIQTVIENIKTNAKGNPCFIQFGNGSTTLDIGSDGITFDGSGSPSWGTVYLSGKLIGSETGGWGSIRLENNASIYSRATLTASTQSMIINNSGGTVEILGGTVSATSGYAIYNAANGSVFITGGTVKTTSGVAVYNAWNGPVNISDGTVSATTGSAVRNDGSGRVTISGGTISATTGRAIYSVADGLISVQGGTVTSASPGSTGTIYLYNNGNGFTGRRLEISWGTVENTNSDYGTVIQNDSTGTVYISGGTVSAARGTAVRNNSTGKVEISGGTITARAGGDARAVAVSNDSTGTVTISGGTLSTDESNASTVSSGSGTVTISGGGQIKTTAGRAIDCYGGRVDISGDFSSIWNAISATTGDAVYASSSGNVYITGARIQATTGYAIRRTGSSYVQLSGNTVVFAYGTSDTSVISGSYTQTGNSVIVAWNTSVAPPNNTGIYKKPSDASALWSTDSGVPTMKYITVNYNTNRCSIYLPEVSW